MAMIGSASRASRGNTMSGSSTDDNPPARPRPRNARGGGGGGREGGGESEGSEDEVTERGSEVCQIGDDMCTVPSELFNLPSLKGVLSLNTWNYCLTGSEFIVLISCNSIGYVDNSRCISADAVTNFTFGAFCQFIIICNYASSWN